MFGSKMVTGLDIGANSIKVVQLRPGSDGLELVNFDLAKISPLPSEERDKKIVETLREILSNYKIGHLVVALPRHLAIVKHISLPSKDETELKNMIGFEAARHIPFKINEVELAFQVIDSQGKGSEILLVAVQKEVINHYLYLLSQAGLGPEIIDLSSFALFNAIKYNQDNRGVFALIDIGEEETEINIIKDNILRFTRSVPIAGKRLSLSIQKELDVSLDEAEAIKKRDGLGGEIREISKSWLDSLTKEIKRSIETFKSESEGAKIERIILTGAGCRLPWLGKFMQEAIGIGVCLFDPLKKIRFDSTKGADAVACELAVGIGLALRRNIKNKLAINLLPSEVRLRKKARKKKIKAIILALSTALLILLGSGRAIKDLFNRQYMLSFLEQKIQETESEVRQAKKIRAQADIIGAYAGQRTLCLEVLREISLICPSEIRLNNLLFEKEGIQLQGVTPSYSAVSELAAILEKSTYFEDVVLIYSRKGEEEEMVEFALRASLAKILPFIGENK